MKLIIWSQSGLIRLFLPTQIRSSTLKYLLAILVSKKLGKKVMSSGMKMNKGKYRNKMIKWGWTMNSTISQKTSTSEWNMSATTRKPSIFSLSTLAKVTKMGSMNSEIASLVSKQSIQMQGAIGEVQRIVMGIQRRINLLGPAKTFYRIWVLVMLQADLQLHRKRRPIKKIIVELEGIVPAQPKIGHKKTKNWLMEGKRPSK